MAGVKTVTELLNLFIDPGIVPDVIIGPSHFSIEYGNLRMLRTASGETPHTKVISPGVDIHKFKSSKSITEKFRDVITIAYFGRLAIEKNVGLFLLTASELLKKNALLRFVIIGDGDIKEDLQELSRRLEINWAVRFTGMLSGEQLIETLETVDIAINPSLRAWSETFCIANIEVI